MNSYLNIVREVLDNGVLKPNRTGVNAKSISGIMFEHDMANGFPLLTTKKVPLKSVLVELEFFIKGLTDKQWLQDRGCHIWDEWCAPYRVKYAHDDETKAKMKAERDLGPIYGYQWRRFGADYGNHEEGFSGVDQLKEVVNKLKSNPTDRRMIVIAWNPEWNEFMALPPCHYGFQLLVTDGKLDLLWNQRSVDVMLGLPFNIASYATLLHLLAKEANLKEGKLIGFLADTHIYENHIEGAKLQLSRTPRTLPTIKTENFTSIFDWTYDQTTIENYTPEPPIKFEIAV